MKKVLLLMLAMCAASIVCVAADKKKVQQKAIPMGFDNMSFAVFYHNGTNIFELKGKPLFEGRGIFDLKLNPSNTAVATLQKDKKGRTSVVLNDINPSHPESRRSFPIYKDKDNQPMAIAYSADAKRLAIAYANQKINIFTPTIKVIGATYTSALVPTKMVFSDNNYFLGAAAGRSLEIWNLDKGTVRKTLTMESNIRDFCFSNQSSNLMVLTADAKLFIYDTKTFDLLYTIEDLGEAIACVPNNNGKYAAVINNDKLISVVNIFDPSERHMITDEVGGITTCRMVYHESKGKHYIIYNNFNSIVYEEVEGLKPYYNQMMTTQLNERMNQWMKQMPGESMADYQLRVNDSTRVQQAQAIERELATQMATGMLESSEISVGNYNPNTRSLALKISNMPDILIGVPMDEVATFGDGSKLQFRNAKYALNPDDKFELVYVEVFNPENGKTYVFDNLQRKSMSQLTMDTDFVPLEIIQKSNMEETALMNIKEDIFNLAKQENLLSDKTHISVQTGVVNAVNADGQRIINYNVDFTYEVEEEFSARDDFKPGRYHVEESNAAMIMLKIMTKAFENDFAKYMVAGKQVKIKVKGSADASPIHRALAYDGRYGEYDGEPVYMNNELTNLSLTKKDGIASNEQLAFARALGVQNYIEHEISGFSEMKRDYEYHIEVSKEEGSKFRRISVQYTFVDAF